MKMIPVPYKKFKPEFRQGAYSSADALSFAIASELAYEKTSNGAIAKTKIINRAKAWKFPRVRIIESIRGKDIDTQGYVMANNKHIVIAFRGSDAPEFFGKKPMAPDWYANAQAVKDPGPFKRSKIHEGFQDAFFATALEIGHHVGRIRDKEQEVWITGHSLGGALAVILAATMITEGIPVTGLYTFGAPRVGNRNFQRQFDQAMKGAASFRVANTHDIVPQLPPEFLGYSHTGNRMLLTPEFERTTSRSTWRAAIADAFKYLAKRGLSRFRIVKHHVLASEGGYIDLLQRQHNP